MLKKMLKRLGKVYKYCGIGLLWCPKILVKLWKKADESTLHFVGAVLGTPFIVFETFGLGALIIVGALVFTAVAILLALPIAGIADLIKKLIDCCTTSETKQVRPMASIHINEQEFSNTNAKILASLPRTTTPVESLDKYTSYTQAYIDSFKNSLLNSDTIKINKLTPEEELLLKDYLDPITSKIIDIAVRMNENTFDLSTLETILNNDSKDPFSNLKFKRRDIQPARDVNEKIQKLLVSIIKNREISDPEQNASPKPTINRAA